MRVSITEQKTALEKERCVEVIKSMEKNHGNVEVHKPAVMGKFHAVCITLIALLILGSVTLGVFVYKLVSRIMLTILCNVNPLEPHFYIVKLGFAGIFIIFN